MCTSWAASFERKVVSFALYALFNDAWNAGAIAGPRTSILDHVVIWEWSPFTGAQKKHDPWPTTLIQGYLPRGLCGKETRVILNILSLTARRHSN